MDADNAVDYVGVLSKTEAAVQQRYLLGIRLALVGVKLSADVKVEPDVVELVVETWIFSIGLTHVHSEVRSSVVLFSHLSGPEDALETAMDRFESALRA